MEEIKNKLDAAELQLKIQTAHNLKETTKQNGYQKTIDGINLLRWLCESQTPDHENSVIGSETKYKKTFNEEECKKIKVKIFNLIEKL